MPEGSAAGSNANFVTSVQYVEHHMVPPRVLEDSLGELAIGMVEAPTGNHLDQLLLQKGPSANNLSILVKWLESYPDQEATSYLIEGVKFGFRIPVQGKRVATLTGNLRSFKGMEDIMWENISKEIS